MFANVDFIQNGEVPGEFKDMFTGNGKITYDPGLCRPFIDVKGNLLVNVQTGRTENRKDNEGKIVMNSDGSGPVEYKVTENRLVSDLNLNSNIYTYNTSLRKDEWQMIDRAVLKEARQRLRLWGDIAARNTFGGFNGMAKSILEHETMDDPGFAQVDMDGLTEGRSDQPRFQREGLPLPITHSDFTFGSRKLAESRNTGTPLDLNMAELAARRVSEMIEEVSIGIKTGMTYGTLANYSRNSTAYGLINYPDRGTKTDMTAPTGANGETILTDWLALRDVLYADNMYGPYIAYTSNDYDEFLDNLFSTTEPSAGTLRSRLLQIDGISAIRRLDFLTGSTNDFEVILVQMTPDVIRAVNGLDMTTVRWEAVGGMRLNFKVMAIHVVQIRSDYDGRCGIAHGSVA